MSEEQLTSGQVSEASKHADVWIREDVTLESDLKLLRSWQSIGVGMVAGILEQFKEWTSNPSAEFSDVIQYFTREDMDTQQDYSESSSYMFMLVLVGWLQNLHVRLEGTSTKIQ